MVPGFMGMTPPIIQLDMPIMDIPLHSYIWGRGTLL